MEEEISPHTLAKGPRNTLTQGNILLLGGNNNFAAHAIRQQLARGHPLDDWRNIGDANAVDASGNDDWGDMVEFNENCPEGGIEK